MVQMQRDGLDLYQDESDGERWLHSRQIQKVSPVGFAADGLHRRGKLKDDSKISV